MPNKTRPARLAASLLAASVVWGMSAAALASPFEMYGASGRSTALAGAQTATAEGPSSIFYNIGALARSEEGVSGGLLVGLSRAQILLMSRPDGYDIPDLGAYSPAVPSASVSTPRQDSTELGNLYTLTVGGVTSLGVKNLRLGILIGLPSSGYIDAQTHFSDERERLFSNQLHFTLIDQRLRRMELEMGVAYQIADWISAGLGANFSPGTTMATSVYLPDVSKQDEADLNADIDTASNWGLIAGVLLDLSDDIKLGLQYRSESFFRISGQNRIRVGTSGDEEERRTTQTLNWTPSYSPDTISAGLAMDFGQSTLMLDGRYERWAGFQNAHSEHVRFDNIISPRLGFEYALSSGNKLRGGLGWAPSPVPEQRGRTNYVDNDRYLASFGASYGVDVMGLPLVIDWALQLQLLQTRVTHKSLSSTLKDCAPGVDVVCDEVPDTTINPRTGQPFEGAEGLQTGNPGFPGFTSGGWMGAVMVELSWLSDHSETEIEQEIEQEDAI